VGIRPARSIYWVLGSGVVVSPFVVMTTNLVPGKPELVIALVAPTGTSFDAVAKTLEDALHLYEYETARIRLSDYLAESAGLNEAERQNTKVRIATLQTEGNRLRRQADDGAILARVAIQEIRSERAKAQVRRHLEVNPEAPVSGLAYLVWSLKHPDEATLLRSVYGTHFVLVSMYTPEESRISTLSKLICRDRGVREPAGADKEAAIGLIETDEFEAGDVYGQRVRSVFPEADFFVDASNLEKTVQRAVDVFFGDAFATPTRDEYGMFMAHAAALRSAELGRQVGAAIAAKDGEIISLGVNEVPRSGGGPYWADDEGEDHREFTRGSDTSDERKRTLAEKVAAALKTTESAIEHPLSNGLEEETASRAVDALLRDSGLRDLIEFGRAVHAEMGALTDAARRGVSVKRATLFVTTFPCHHCARHIVAAGIDRVVFVHPYPKSLAIDLHSDAIRLCDYADREELVAFESFRGVAPRQYLTMFTMGDRKHGGLAVERYDKTRWPKPIAVERGQTYKVNAYLQREALIASDWKAPEEKGQNDESSKE
jgi:deoxycytidylate deaminase